MRKRKKKPETLPVNNVQFFHEVASAIANGHTVTITTHGTSMYPFIQGGIDKLVLDAPTSLAVADIVLARLPQQEYVLHRIIRKEGNRLTLMGDGNLQATESCRTSDVIAKVISIQHPKGAQFCQSARFRRQSRLWMHLLPVRRHLLAVLKRIRPIHS